MMINDKYLIVNPCTSAVPALKREMSYCTQLYTHSLALKKCHRWTMNMVFGSSWSPYSSMNIHSTIYYWILQAVKNWRHQHTSSTAWVIRSGVVLCCPVISGGHFSSSRGNSTMSKWPLCTAEWCFVFPKQQVSHLQEHRWRGKRHQNSLNSHFLRYVSCMHADRKVLLVCSAFLYPFCIFIGGLILRLRLANMTDSSQHLILKMWRLMYNSNLPSSTFSMEHAHIQFMTNFQYCSAFLTKAWNYAIVIKVCNVRGQL